jgi:hypothetical protein
MNLVLWVFSPSAMLCAIFISYFYLLFTLPFLSQRISDDLFILGIFCGILSIIFFRFKYKRVEPNKNILTVNLIVINLLFLLIEIYLRIIFKFDFSPQLDNRFLIPGFGLISSLFLIGSLFGIAILSNVQDRLQKYLFIGLLFIIGVQIGGKGFIIPLLFGYGLSIRLGFREFKLIHVWALFGGALVAIFGLFLILGGNFSDAIDHIIIRLMLSADSVNWLSKMEYVEILKFPIENISYFSDIILRLVGLRINQRAVGSEIAYLVAGDDAGGGPNSNLPILIYLLNHGNIIASFVLMTTIFILLKIAIEISSFYINHRSINSFYFYLIIFIMPNIVIDLMVFLQFIFWIMIIYLSSALWIYFSGEWEILQSN